jgi:hypothetical protein
MVMPFVALTGTVIVPGVVILRGSRWSGRGLRRSGIGVPGRATGDKGDGEDGSRQEDREPVWEHYVTS